jgi:hypothetical protein
MARIAATAQAIDKEQGEQEPKVKSWYLGNSITRSVNEMLID